MQSFFAGQMDFVFFVYGLAFFVLGASCLTLRTDAFPRLPLGWLAGFALSHGASEWLDLAVLSVGPAQGLVMVKTAAMMASFLFLLEFGRRSLCRSGLPFVLGAWLPLLLLALTGLAGALGGLRFLDVAARYLLGLPGGLLGAAAIYGAARSSRSGIRPWLLALAAQMAIYAALAGAITPRCDLFFGEILSYERFLALTGVPVQVLRALFAMGMAIALWLGSQIPVARARGEEIPFHYALGLAGAMLVLIPGGWALTEALARQSYDEISVRGGYQTHALARVVDKEMERIGQAAQLLAVNDAVKELASHPGESSLRAANQVLDQVAIAFQLQVAYLIDTSGTVTASSDRRASDSFVGRNYGFRPYFQSAMDGRDASDVALGVTSRTFGHYASAPVWGEDGNVRLVAALKSSLPPLAAIALEASDCMLLGPSGVVLDACDSRLALQALWPLSEQETRALIESRQLGPGPFPPLLPTRPTDGDLVSWQGRDALYVNAPLLHEGWFAAVLMPLGEVRTYRLFGIGATLVLCLLAIGFYVLLHGHESYELRLRALMAQLREQAHTDPLTGLANRGWFQENFARELAKAERLDRSLSLVMFDIDYFKSINDRFGHQAGDRVLVALAEQARSTLRQYDLLSRWGGEEFVALLPDTGIEGACDLAERLRLQIASMELREIGAIACSFGVAERCAGEDADSLVNRADAALYRAKEAGRNRVARGSCS